MSGELTAFSLACGLGVAAVFFPPTNRPSGPDGFRFNSTQQLVIQRGTTQTFDVIIDRREGFNETLTLQVAAPRGISATLSSQELTPDHEGVIRLTVTAQPHCCIGRRTITVGGFHDYIRVRTIPIHLCVVPDEVPDRDGEPLRN